MKKVLILAYDFPPYVSVGGIRPFSWYKLFPKYGVHPVVITRQWSNKFNDIRDYVAPSKSTQVIVESDGERTMVQSPYFPNLANRTLLKYGEKKYRGFRRSISAFFEFGQFLFPIGPKIQLYKAAREYLRNNKVDAIIATGDPFILFKYASKLSKEFGIPWVADYRDPWTHDTTKKKNFIINSWDSYFEKRIVSRATSVVTVSGFIEEYIKGIIPESNCHIVTNGYDPDALELALPVIQSKDVFKIGYAGTLANWAPVESFLRACDTFISNGENVKMEINFYGIEKSTWLKEIISSKYPNLEQVVQIHPRIPNTTLLKELAQNNAFLLFNCYSIIGTKIFDYLALKRLILLCYTDDKDANQLKKQYFHIKEDHHFSKHPQADLINSTQSGIIVKDENHLIQVLNDLYTQFLDKGYIECKSVNSELYSRDGQAKKLIEILEQLKF